MYYQYFVYILKCADASFYTGITSNLAKRFEEHQQGVKRDSYTYKRRPLELVFQQEFNDVLQAIYLEKKIKGWTRAKKQALIDGNGELLQLLSECRNASHHKYNPENN
tara:strand:- start:140 stop:463 length:324 start_codon:yes stop_codon:yes gene_type:complete